MSDATSRITQDERAELAELIGQVRTLRVLAEAGVAYIDFNAGSQLESAEMRGFLGVIMDRAQETWRELDQFATDLAPGHAVVAAQGGDHG